MTCLSEPAGGEVTIGRSLNEMESRLGRTQEDNLLYEIRSHLCQCVKQRRYAEYKREDVFIQQ